jgi:hypothetical protein
VGAQGSDQARLEIEFNVHLTRFEPGLNQKEVKVEEKAEEESMPLPLPLPLPVLD